MPAIAFRSVASNYMDSGTSVTVNKPTGTLEGDFLVAFCLGNMPSGSDWAFPGDGEWTVAAQSNGDNRMSMGYKVAGESEPSTYEFTFGSSSPGAVIVVTLVHGQAGIASSETSKYETSDVNLNEVTHMKVTAFGSNNVGTITKPETATLIDYQQTTDLNLMACWQLFELTGFTGTESYSSTDTDTDRITWTNCVRQFSGATPGSSSLGLFID